jgi:hypothetical protein
MIHSRNCNDGDDGQCAVVAGVAISDVAAIVWAWILTPYPWVLVDARLTGQFSLPEYVEWGTWHVACAQRWQSDVQA